MAKENEKVVRQYWAVVAVSTAVALAATVRQIRADNSTRTGQIKYIVSAQVITMCIAFIFALPFVSKVDLMQKVEVWFAWVNLVLWVVAIAGIFHRSDLALSKAPNTEFIVISNASIYYFSWAGVIFSALVVGLKLHGCGKKEFWDKVSRRMTVWGLLTLTTLVALGASVESWRDYSCNAEGKTSSSDDCSTLELSFAFAAIVAGLSLIVMIAAALLKDHKKIMIWVEMLVAAIGVALYAAAVYGITGANGVGSRVNNLYYFSWGSLIVSIGLFSDCLDEKFGKKKTEEVTSEDEATPEDMQKATPEPAPEAAMAETPAAPVGEAQV
jgi:hypothetical protein